MKEYFKSITLKFRPLANYLLNIGIDSKVNRSEVKYVRFINAVVVLTVMGFFFYIPFSFYQKQYVLGCLQLVDVICVLTVMRINYLGHHKTARQFYLLLLNIFILTDSCVIGYESRVSDFFYLSYLMPFLLFSVKDYKNIVSGIAMAIIFFYIYQHIYPWFTSYNLNPLAQVYISHINEAMKFVFFGISVSTLAYYNFSSESELALSNQKLHAQAAELKRSNEDLEQFAYIISHDLKAPVRSIGGFMKLLLSRNGAELKEDSREFIELSKASAERMSKQIDDLLSYCSVGRNLSPPSAVDLNEMIKTIQSDLGEKFSTANGNLIVERPLPVMKNVHPSMLHHIFQNLIANGIKFNTSEKPEVKVDFVEERKVITFSITDNGIGIEPVYKDKLFQMFNRLHTNEKFEGTGIGLAACKKIVDFYKGNIWFNSTPGKGTSFFFTLPKTV